MKLFYDNGISCPLSLTLNNKNLFKIKGKPCCVYSFIEGRPVVKPNLEQLKSLGNSIAQLHQFGDHSELFRENMMLLPTWKFITSQFSKSETKTFVASGFATLIVAFELFERLSNEEKILVNNVNNFSSVRSFSSIIQDAPALLSLVALTYWWLSLEYLNGINIDGILATKISDKLEAPALDITKCDLTKTSAIFTIKTSILLFIQALL